MILKIKSIKNLGIFHDAQWNNNLGQFKRFNLIYGWNGSGKTTLSLLFNILKGEPHPDFPECTFKVDSEEGEFTESTDFPKEIRVFNNEYVEKNITIESGKTNPIFILGEENQELVEQISADEKLLNGDSDSPDNIGLIQELKQNRDQQSILKKDRDKEFTDVAKLIGSNTTGVLSRNYRKPNAEIEFGNMEHKEKLTKKDLAKYDLTLKQQKMSADLKTTDISNILHSIDEIQVEAKELLHTTVESVVIEHLKNDSEISEWVEKGLAIHAEKNLTNCEFCKQKIPATRMRSLLSHFNDADKELKEKIDKLLDELRELYRNIDDFSMLDKANLFEEFRVDYEEEYNNFSHFKADLLKSIEGFGNSIKNKKMNTTTELELEVNIETDKFSECVTNLNKLIKDHCDKSQKFEKMRKEAASKIERHYLSEIWDNVKALDKNIENLKKEEEVLRYGDSTIEGSLGIAALEERIKENKNKISTSGPACDEINEKLSTFLGRSEITFELEEDGYLIKRKSEIVKNLSEGEKTAIAFVYFTIHLKDLEYDLTNGIVVIDDPISSLDSNSLFQAFSFLKNAVKDAHQVFILTHNFDFMRLILGWLKRAAGNSSRYFMVNNRIESDERVAYMGELDSALREFNSEYQYLFKLLDGFTSDGTIASVYHIPNVARKVLETFLMLMYPDALNSFKKLEKVNFDEVKKTAIYKFTNDQSHMTGKGFDPSLIPECQKNVEYLLEMIKVVFPTHYDSLKNLQ